MKLWNPNVIGLALVVGAFAVSLYVVLDKSFSRGSASDDGGGGRVVLMHWQLEPGYREAMQWVMDEYNALPHVQAAGITVEQLPVTERIYAQVLNVNLLSGTGADISERGMSALISNQDYAAEFFEPLGTYAEEPNPYNQGGYLPPGLHPKLQEELQDGPWRDTFVDGMRGGWLDSLQDFYAVPTSFWGGLRVYYNEQMLDEGKRLLREKIAAEPQPQWVRQFWLTEGEDGEPSGYLRNNEALHAWLGSAEPPQTLGQFLMYCEAIKALARQRGDDKLVPLAGSSYSYRQFLNAYIGPFTRDIAYELDIDRNLSVNPMETWAGFADGVWSFESPNVRSAYQIVRRICTYFPPGFIGLDREQARRRFVSEQAAMISTGAWDANGIFQTVEGEVLAPGESAPPGREVTTIDGLRYVDHRFGVTVAPFPLPGPGERWHEQIGGRSSEAGRNAGAPFNVYQHSPNKKWAVDFLQYLTSYRINQSFNRRAGWMPCVVGTSAAPKMQPFAPIVAGTHPAMSLSMGHGGAAIDTVYSGQIKNFLSGDITYDWLAGQIRSAVEEPRTGVRRLWFTEYRDIRENNIGLERHILVQATRHMVMDDAEAPDRIKRIVQRSVSTLDGAPLIHAWQRQHPDEPFPDF